jgi:hypothetical protein
MVSSALDANYVFKPFSPANYDGNLFKSLKKASKLGNLNNQSLKLVANH